MESIPVKKSVIRVADIYIRDISNFKTVAAGDNFAKKYREEPRNMIKRSGAIVSMSGDFYALRNSSIVLRNGVLYRGKPDRKQDLCILYWDGRMETVSIGEFDLYAEIDRGAYQIWSFGPKLLDENGEAMRTFNHGIESVDNAVNGMKARSALGYYEPGHYCFVAADGGITGYPGISLQNLSKVMNMLGCKRAYNLDGGRSSQLFVGTKMYNKTFAGGRALGDMLAIVEGE